ncbi:MAG: FUSC family protein [Oscillospiraceae bacterium]|nr:FUSC family protein [Oscillospiraceae bacterium]
MKDYFETKSRKSASYFYYGLISAGLTALMIVEGILALTRVESLGVVITAFVSALLWGSTSFLSLYVFYTDNRSKFDNDKLDSDEL